MRNDNTLNCDYMSIPYFAMCDAQPHSYTSYTAKYSRRCHGGLTGSITFPKSQQRGRGRKKGKSQHCSKLSPPPKFSNLPLIFKDPRPSHILPEQGRKSHADDFT